MHILSMGLKQRKGWRRQVVLLLVSGLALAACILCAASLVVPTCAYAATATHNIGSGSCTCDDEDTDYVRATWNRDAEHVAGLLEEAPV